MAEAELSEFTLSTFKTVCSSKPGIDKNSLEIGHQTPLDELQQKVIKANDIDLQKYFNCAMLVKLCDDAPTKRIDLYKLGARLFDQAPEYIPSIAGTCDSILANEISNFENDENALLDLCEESKLVSQRHAESNDALNWGFCNLSLSFMEKASKIDEHTTFEEYIADMNNLIRAQSFGYEIDALGYPFVTNALDFIEEKNDFLNQKTDAKFAQESYQLLILIKKINYKDDALDTQIKSI